MATELKRRHSRTCTAKQKFSSFTYESDELRRGKDRVPKCECGIHFIGTLNGQFVRRSTERSDWRDAEAVVKAWVTDQSVPAPAPARVAATPVDPMGKTIEAAVEAYLNRCENRGIKLATLRKYKTMVKQLLAFAEKRGYAYLQQFSIDDMDEFYNSWKDGIRSKAKKLERLRQFVKFCLKRNWLTVDVTEDLEAPEGSSKAANKSPFTDAELNRIYAVCDCIGEAKPGPGSRNWTGQDVRDFIDLAIYTGLRISDLATFDITKKLDGNSVFLRTHKTNKPVFTYLPDDLVARLWERQAKYGNLIFKSELAESVEMRAMIEVWRGRLAYVFKEAGKFEEKATPHRFRHTFVRIMLNTEGVTVRDVADLIGDTEEMVLEHYAKWVPERQERLTNILKKAFANRQQPKLVAVAGNRKR